MAFVLALATVTTLNATLSAPAGQGKGGEVVVKPTPSPKPKGAGLPPRKATSRETNRGFLKLVSLPMPDFKAEDYGGPPTTNKISVELRIDERGKVVMDAVQASYGYPPFMTAILGDLERQRFPPLAVHGRPVKSVGTMAYEFVAKSNVGADPSIEAAVNTKPIRNQIGIEMVWIPPGKFLMGSTNGSNVDGHHDEQPVHQVTINYSFYMGKCEVTQAQWQSVMKNNPSDFEDCANCPVEQVSWEDAQGFIRTLNLMNDGYIYRLPTEAEWEYACRAATTTDFSFGSSLGSTQANIDGQYPYGGAPKGVYRSKTTPVGSFQPNAFGLFDMHGNVLEWCEDLYHDSYDDAPSDGSAWLSGEQTERVLRGGSWDAYAFISRSAARFHKGGDKHNFSTGFRVVAVARSR